MVATKTIRPLTGLNGEIEVPGDKSISHRSIMFSALADSPVEVEHFLFAQDCLSTISCFKQLGISIETYPDEKRVVIHGKGLKGLAEPNNVLDCGNSGTTMRLMTGLLSAQSFYTVLTGDDSLRRRPMKRVFDPLRTLGAKLVGRQDKWAPVAILPSSGLTGTKVELPVASAQLKSAVLLAGLFASGKTEVTEPFLSRNHTELMLKAFGVSVKTEGAAVTLEPPQSLKAPAKIIVPGDISSAAFWLVAGSIIPNSRILVHNVGLNPTRAGVIEVLKAMGAQITLQNLRQEGGEEVADCLVESAELTGTEIAGALIPRLIDEIPILVVAALWSKGRTVIADAQELRVKESDRLAAIVQEFSRLGAKIEERPDGLIIDGPQNLTFGQADSHDDHRIAMALAIAGAAANGVTIEKPQCVDISYPEFYETLEALAGQEEG